ncbi:MAG: AAA family ATPase [Proteobacteria bacterium]|nr:AAA family ATPase [Pseudomonadota bacterium]
MSVSGKTVGLTGTLDGVSRAEFRRMVADAGATYSATLDDSVDLLVIGERPLGSRVDQAKSLDIDVIDQETFQAMLSGSSAAASGHEPSADDDVVPLAVESIEDAAPSIAILDEHTLRVLDIPLDRRPPGPLTPSLDFFAHYTLDAPTLRTLRFLARAVKLKMPCLLEGETATSKTSSISFLAALTGHQLVRINLNGQTDTSELVGRYIPNEEQVRLPVDEMMNHLELLEDESRMILERAQQTHRGLTGVEKQQIAANEGIQPPQWRFQEGLIPQAMRNGWWVILDEVNLAEPQVLERLNSVLERNPTLVLTEGPGTRFGPNGDCPVDPNFRIFATMNPAEYQGRSVLSPAYKDRWTATWQAQSPGEVEYRQMLQRLIFGNQPNVEIDGSPWRGGPSFGTPYASLSTVPGMGEFLSRLAALHAGLVRMAMPADGKPPSLGVSRRERYVFSRRGLLAVLDGLGALEVMDPKSQRRLTFTEAPETIAMDTLESVYVDRIRGDEDRSRVIQLLRSLGLHRQNWMHRFEDKPAS